MQNCTRICLKFKYCGKNVEETFRVRNFNILPQPEITNTYANEIKTNANNNSHLQQWQHKTLLPQTLTLKQQGLHVY